MDALLASPEATSVGGRFSGVKVRTLLQVRHPPTEEEAEGLRLLMRLPALQAQIEKKTDFSGSDAQAMSAIALSILYLAKVLDKKSPDPPPYRFSDPQDPPAG